jgi:hypothetical protein
MAESKSHNLRRHDPTTGNMSAHGPSHDLIFSRRNPTSAAVVSIHGADMVPT